MSEERDTCRYGHPYKFDRRRTIRGKQYRFCVVCDKARRDKQNQRLIEQKTHCNHGHEYRDGTFTIVWKGGDTRRYQSRVCLVCQKEREEAVRIAKPDPMKHCRNGHRYTPENTRFSIWRGKQYVRCRACDSLWQKKNRVLMARIAAECGA